MKIVAGEMTLSQFLDQNLSYSTQMPRDKQLSRSLSQIIFRTSGPISIKYDQKNPDTHGIHQQ
jgi:hypothetical protein